MADNLQKPERLIDIARRRKQTQGRRGLKKRATAIRDPIQLRKKFQIHLARFVKNVNDKISEWLIDQLEQLQQQLSFETSNQFNNTTVDRSDDFNDEVSRIMQNLRNFADNAADDAQDDLNSVAQDVSEWNRNQIARSLKKVIGVDVFSQQSLDSEFLNTMLKSWVIENTDLIKSIHQEQLRRVSNIVYRGFRQGDDHRAIAKTIREQFGKTENRARFIARDQVSKLNGQLTEQRNRKLNIHKYIWRTSEDERVRESHKVMNGKECRWDDNTLYRNQGEDTWRKRSSIGGVEEAPGQDYQCRCDAIPVLEDVVDSL